MKESKYTPEMLSCLPREELRCLLAEELNKDTTIIDDAFVRLLLTELKNRGADPTFIDDDAVEAVCEKFRTDMEPTQKLQKHWYQSWMLKVASVALVLGILFYSIPGAVRADPVSDVLGWWLDSVFQFITPGERPLVQEYVFETDHPGLQQIYDAVRKMGITEQIVPRKLSGDYILLELKTLQFMGDESIHAHLVSEDKELMFTIIIHDEADVMQHEKDEENVSVWELAGVEHYVISNKEDLIITWIVDKIECTISTNCPEEEIYQFIQSIYT